jgi:uncharacterized membrane protein YbhN (UPF0104 family)
MAEARMTGAERTDRASEPARCAGDDERRLFGVSRRRAILTAILGLGLGVGAPALLGNVADLHLVASAVMNADRSWLPVCVAGEIAAYVGYIVAYRDVARVEGGPALDVWTATRVVIVGFGATLIGASAGGLAADFWALRRSGASADESSRRVLALNTLEWTVLSLAAMLAALAVLAGRGPGAPAAMTLSWIAAVPACVAAGWWVSRGERGRRLSRAPEGGPSLSRGPGAGRAGSGTRPAAVSRRRSAGSSFCAT